MQAVETRHADSGAASRISARELHELQEIANGKEGKEEGEEEDRSQGQEEALKGLTTNRG